MKDKSNKHRLNPEDGKKNAAEKTASPNGSPYSGEPACLDAELFESEAEIPRTVAICGCGRSKSLPYCDGSHECYKSL